MRMRRGIGLILSAWLLVYMQSTLSGWIAIKGMAPDLLCVLIMLTALRMGPLAAMRIGFLAGFLADCFHPDTMGLHSSCYSAAGFAGATLRDRIYRGKLLSQVAASAALALLLVPLVAALRSGGGFFTILFRHGIGSALYTGGAALFLAPLLGRLVFPADAGRGYQP